MPFGVRGGVVFRSLLDPGSEQRYLELHQRSFAFRHAHLTVLRRDHLEDRAFVRMTGHDCRTLAIAPGQQPLELGHDIAALGFRRLMAALTVGLEDGTDFAVVTYLCRGVAALGFGILSSKSRRNQEG